MTTEELLLAVSKGRTDLIFELLDQPNADQLLGAGTVSPLQWLVYYGDVTAMRAVLKASHSLDRLSLDHSLSDASFFGWWKMVDFLIDQGADPNWKNPTTHETPLHSAICKAGRPAISHVVRLLLERGADPNAVTLSDQKTDAFMRDIRTRGETPLHRAAAFADEVTIKMLLDSGANKEARDANGDSPLTWASWHLRPGSILQLLSFPPYKISDKQVQTLTSDHGSGWGNGMERKLLGDYLPLS